MVNCKLYYLITILHTHAENPERACVAVAGRKRTLFRLKENLVFRIESCHQVGIPEAQSVRINLPAKFERAAWYSKVVRRIIYSQPHTRSKLTSLYIT